MKFIFHSTTWSSRQKERGKKKKKHLSFLCQAEFNLKETGWIVHHSSKEQIYTTDLSERQVNAVQKSYPFQNGRLEFNPTIKCMLSSIHLFRLVMASFKSSLPWSFVLNMAYIPTKIPISVNAGYLPAPQKDLFFLNSYWARTVACRADFICSVYCDHQVWVRSKWNSQAFPSHLLCKALNRQSQKWSKEQLHSPPLWAAHIHAFSST